MTEQIGGVRLDYSKYPGEDYYSEGQSEDKLLELVEAHEETAFNQVIMGNWSWPVLYHLSHIRPNIIRWLPLQKTDKVLEIGSGCGAITGALADMAGSVTCVELSRKRSRINAIRNKKRDNIEILVGNLQDIEAGLTQKYQYIMLIGVFEYAPSYIRGERPFERFLQMMRKHLAPGGRIVIAIENKYGLKYWAGCKEDHTGRYYDGIEGYPAAAGVKTFSKQELEQLFSGQGLKYRFYYPYPDYKFPMSIYSDRYLPKTGELNNNLRNFDGNRIVAFDESRAFDELIHSGMFPFFSNSFEILLEEAEEGALEVETVYTKFSNERREELQIKTAVREEAGACKVSKAALTGAALDHIGRLRRNVTKLEQLYEGTKLRPNKILSREDAGQAVFEFLSGKTLEQELDRHMAAAEYDQMLAILKEYQEMVLRTHSTDEYQETEAFLEIFGPCTLSGQRCGRICNLDLIFSNLILRDGKGGTEWCVIDYEWTFDFPVPVKYVLFRALYYYLLTKERIPFLSYLGNNNPDWGREKAYELFGLSVAEREAFTRMEQQFQQYILGRTVSLYVAHALIGGLTMDLRELEKEGAKVERLHMVKAYYDMGNGFHELKVHYIRGIVTDNARVAVEIPVEEGAVALRIDPTEFPCIIRIKEFSAHPGKAFDYYVNGILCNDKTVLFDTHDAQLVIKELTGQEKSFYLEYEVSVLLEDTFQDIKEEIEKMQQKMYQESGSPHKLLCKLGLAAKAENPVDLSWRAMQGD